GFIAHFLLAPDIPSACVSYNKNDSPCLASTVTSLNRIFLVLATDNPVSAVMWTFSRTTFSTGLSGRPTMSPAFFVEAAVGLAMRMLRKIGVVSVIGWAGSSLGNNDWELFW